MQEHKRRWDTDGWCVIPGVVPPDLLAAVQTDLARLLPTAEDYAADPESDRNRPFRLEASPKLRFPYESQALNRLTVADPVIDLAEELLGVGDLRLYQSQVNAKFSGGAPDQEQLLHADYGNHTLVVPRADPGYQQVTMFIYLSEVTPELAATRIVSRPITLARGIPVERTYLHLEEYADVYEQEQCASGPAGSVLAYRPDVYHRGVRLMAPASARYIMAVAFKPPNTDWLGSQSWPSACEDLSWHAFMRKATMRQLLVLGFPEPGNAYWTAETLDGVAARYPFLDMTPWRAAFAAGMST